MRPVKAVDVDPTSRPRRETRVVPAPLALTAPRPLALLPVALPRPPTTRRQEQYAGDHGDEATCNGTANKHSPCTRAADPPDHAEGPTGRQLCSHEARWVRNCQRPRSYC